MTHADISSIHWVFVNKKFHFEGTPLVVQNHWWGFPTLPYGVLFSRGWGVQWNDNGGRCGICGDAWGDFPREHEAPLGQLFSCGIFYVFFSKSGKFATGTLVRHYTSGSWVPVIVDITTNHGGYFAFKVIRNGSRENIKMWRVCMGIAGPPVV